MRKPECNTARLREERARHQELERELQQERARRKGLEGKLQERGLDTGAEA